MVISLREGIKAHSIKLKILIFLNDEQKMILVVNSCHGNQLTSINCTTYISNIISNIKFVKILKFRLLRLPAVLQQEATFRHSPSSCARFGQKVQSTALIDGYQPSKRPHPFTSLLFTSARHPFFILATHSMFSPTLYGSIRACVRLSVGR